VGGLRHKADCHDGEQPQKRNSCFYFLLSPTRLQDSFLSAALMCRLACTFLPLT
jgi:hypothetical protein